MEKISKKNEIMDYDFLGNIKTCLLSYTTNQQHFQLILNVYPLMAWILYWNKR